MENVLSAVAVDDEPMALEILMRHASSVAWLDLRRTFISSSAAIAWLTENPVDIVFLDIRMPDRSGMDVATGLAGKHQFIFTTAYTDHATTAFDLYATDYLLKPFSEQRFKVACERALERKNSLRPAVLEHNLFIKSGYDLVKIDIGELLFVQSADNYVIFRERGRQRVGRMTLASLQKRLSAQGFVRVHHSYIVAIRHVERFEDNELVIGKHRIPVSLKYRKDLLGRLK